MAEFRITVEDSGVVAKIRAMVEAGQDLTPLHERIGAGLLSNVQIGFKTSTSPYGQAWAPLKLRTGQPLRDKGLLRNSIKPAADGDGVTVGTNLRYAAVHQFGATIRPKKPGGRLVFRGPSGPIFAREVNIPARPFLPLDGLPAAYQKTVITRIRSHFAQAGE